MPAVHYTLRWPDGRETSCYSPSRAVCEFLQPGTDYRLGDFLARMRQATAQADARVRERYGFSCSRAADQLAVIESIAQTWEGRPEGVVRVLRLSPAP